MRHFPNRLLQATRHRISLAVALIAILGTGCSGQKTDVSGQVTRDGKPLVVGSVVFFPAKGLPVVVALDDQGHYLAPGLVTKGEVQVAIYAADPSEELRALPAGQEYAEERTRLKELRKKWAPIPSRYNDPNRSGLAFTPTSSSTTFDIALTSK